MSNARDKANIPSLNFSSTGIDDNATSTAITINSSEQVGIGETNPDKQLEISSSTGGTLQLTNSSTSIGAGESLGEITFFSNDASGDGTGVRGFIKSVENDGGTGRRYDLTFGTGNRAAATEKLRIDKDGNVGIGTTTMDGKLHIQSNSAGSVTAHVNGSLGVFEASGNNGISILTPDASTSAIFFGSASSNRFAEIKATYDNNFLDIGTRKSGGLIRFATDNFSECMRIDSSGNVGINNSSPIVPLEVDGVVKINEAPGVASGNLIIDSTATGNSQLRFYQGGTAKGYLTYWDSSDTLALTDASANGLHFSPSTQRVGIGTSSPSEKLEVNGTVKATAFQGDGSALTNLPGGGTVLRVFTKSWVGGTTISGASSSWRQVNNYNSERIVPLSTSSKFVIQWTVSGYANDDHHFFKITRRADNGSDTDIGLSGSALGNNTDYGDTGSLVYGRHTNASPLKTFQIYDAPNTTSGFTYQLQNQAHGQTFYFGRSAHNPTNKQYASQNTCIVWEIDGSNATFTNDTTN